MTFESLANELLFDIFEYFSIAQLLHLFYGLNHRFNMLLFDYICIHGLDLRAVSKRDIDTLCQQCPPSIANRITTLCLSDAENSQQTKHFITECLTLYQFTHIRTLHLHGLTSVTTINKMILYCCYLSHLTYLRLNHCYCVPCNQADVVGIVNIIWSLPNLIYCYLDIDSSDDIEFSVPRIISSSLKYLNIPNMICRLSELTYLIEYTPHLQYLSTRFTYDSDRITYPVVVNSSITHFNTWLVAVEQNEIINIFLHMPNLCSLTVQTMNDVCVDGRQWEQTIRDHLTKLKRFRLKLTRKLVNDSNWQQHVDELIDSFRSQFWLEEHRWFVQCDWDPDVVGVYLYTLPYAFDCLTLNFPLISKSTCPHHAYHRSYDRVRQLKYIPSLSEDLGQQRHIRFPNVQNLTLYLPIDNHLWTIVPKFHQLTSLCVAWYKYDQSFPSQLQLLLDRANSLYWLAIETWRSCPTRMAPYELTHASIRKLDFYNYHYHYNNEDCTILSRSVLGMQCEVLRISVENRTCILDLVNQMTNLHHLIVQCLDDTYSEESMTLPDELVKWLQDQMPSTFTITRNTILAYEIDLWIE